MQLSIVIPTLDEADAIAACLRHVAEHAPEAERIVADGGSRDGTPALAAPLARVVASAPGRARQLNAGAAVATGDWLLFLHADTRLPAGCAAAPREAAARGYEMGAFRLRIAGRHALLPLLGWGATQRSRWLGIAFGDQAPFMRREFFARRGGFPDLPLMEDYAFFRALRRDGIGCYLSPLAVVTSGRRWDAQGFWRTWWQMRRNLWRFERGGDPTLLASRYRNIR